MSTFDMEPDFLDRYERCRPYTMTSVERMYALHQAVLHVIDSGVAGDFVECGVWRGGSMMLVALSLLACGVDDREIWLFDTFAGMTAPGDVDTQATTGRPAAEILADAPRTTDDPFWGIAPLDEVLAALGSTGYPPERVHAVVGDVVATVPTQSPSSISVLRLDTDWYASTAHELGHLYPRLTPGGVLLVDDYGYWTGARLATDEYLATRPDRPLLHRIDCTGRIGVRPAGS